MIRNIFWIINNTEGKKNLHLAIYLITLLVNSFLEIIGLIAVIPFVNFLTDYNSFQDSKFFFIEKFLIFTDNNELDFTILFILFYLSKNILILISTRIQFLIQRHLHNLVIIQTYKNIVNEDYSNHIKKKSSETIRLVSYDLMNFGDGSLHQLGILIVELFLFTGVVLAITINNPESVIIIIVIITLLLLVFFLIKIKNLKYSKSLQKIESLIIHKLQDSVFGYKDIKLNNKDTFFNRLFYADIKSRSINKIKRDFLLIFPKYLIEMVMMTLMAIIFYWLIYNNIFQQNLAILSFYALVIIRALPMSNRILSSLNTINSTSPSINEIMKNFKKVSNIKQTKTAKNTIINFENLVFKNVNFNYPKNNGQTLTKINLTINRNEKHAFLGVTGGGKTTLLNLINGLLEPTSGQIKINNSQNITDNIIRWREIIGFVHQDIFLLNDTIKANIAFGENIDEINIERLNKAINLSKLETFILSLPQKENTIIGERGTNISGGQRQRIALARAYYKTPQILILDEATSALDNQTTFEIVNEILNNKDLTIICVSHKLETIKKFDYVHLLDNGTLKKSGNYIDFKNDEELFKKFNFEDNIS